MSSKQLSNTMTSRFSPLVLILLTLQSAGVTILATYTQRGAVLCAPDTAVATALRPEQVCKYSPVHLLATAEVIKFFAAFLWCAADVYTQRFRGLSASSAAGVSLIASGSGGNGGGGGNSVAATSAGVEPAVRSSKGFSKIDLDKSNKSNHLIHVTAQHRNGSASNDTHSDEVTDSEDEVATACVQKAGLVAAVDRLDEGAENTLYKARSKFTSGASSLTPSEERVLDPAAVSANNTIRTSDDTHTHARLLCPADPDKVVELSAAVTVPGPASSPTFPAPSAPSTQPTAPLPRGHVSGAALHTYLALLRVELGLTPDKIAETTIMVIPAILYAAQNTMVLIALQRTDPAVFQLCYLIRILFLAVFMRVALHLQLTARQCVALVLLTLGIGVAQWSPSTTAAGTTTTTTTTTPFPMPNGMMENEMNEVRTATLNDTVGDASAVMVLIMCAALISSGTGVFLEVVFKKRGNHFFLSARNVHLAFFSILYFLLKFLFDYGHFAQTWQARAQFAEQGGAVLQFDSTSHPLRVYLGTFYQGFTPLVWCLVLLQSIAGILLALVMKYSNNIMKTFATSLALLISMAASVLLFDVAVRLQFVMGVMLVLISVFMYNLKC